MSHPHLPMGRRGTMTKLPTVQGSLKWKSGCVSLQSNKHTPVCPPHPTKRPPPCPCPKCLLELGFMHQHPPMPHTSS